MRYLAVDYGQKRIGLAVSDAGESMAFPYSVLETHADLISNIVRIIRQEKIEAIVAGLPINMDGSEGPQAKTVRAFARKLSVKAGMEVVFFDERLSSAQADWKLSGLELSRQKKKKLQDAIAAATFLQVFLDEKKKSIKGPEIIRLQTSEQAAQKALEVFTLCAQETIERQGTFVCAISGGESPKEFFRLLSNEQTLDWKHIHIFWADERWVRPDHPDSNYNLARETFLSKVSIPPGNIHRIETELSDIHLAAGKYENTIRDRLGDIPQFDLIVLGLGTDGHIASLVPGSDVINIQDGLVSVVDMPSLRYPRVTLTMSVLLAAHKLLFLITGSQKAQIVHTILNEHCEPKRWPIHALWPMRHKMTWLLDSEAACLLR